MHTHTRTQQAPPFQPGLRSLCLGALDGSDGWAAAGLSQLDQYKKIFGLRRHMQVKLSFCQPHIRRLDEVQRWYLNEIDFTHIKAFLKYNFLPHSLSPPIDLLGLVQKMFLGLCHSVL